MVITTKSAAAELGISVRRIQALISAGRLRAKRVGRDYLISPRALDAVRVRLPGRPGWQKRGVIKGVINDGGKHKVSL